MSTVQKMGWDAAMQGKTYEDCPYPEDTAVRAAWTKGFFNGLKWLEA